MELGLGLQEEIRLSLYQVVSATSKATGKQNWSFQHLLLRVGERWCLNRRVVYSARWELLKITLVFMSHLIRKVPQFFAVDDSDDAINALSSHNKYLSRCHEWALRRKTCSIIGAVGHSQAQLSDLQPQNPSCVWVRIAVWSSYSPAGRSKSKD